VTEIAESLGLVTGKSWQYSRDTVVKLEKEDVGE
jgi:hypothetical protein